MGGEIVDSEIFTELLDKLFGILLRAFLDTHPQELARLNIVPRGYSLIEDKSPLTVVAVCRIDTARIERYRAFVENRRKGNDVLRWRDTPVVRCNPVDPDEAQYDTDLLKTNNSRTGGTYAVLPDSTA